MSPTRARKYRCCPACGVVRTAADFKPAMSHDHVPGQRVCCPACGHEGLRTLFVPAEPPGGTGDREG